MCFFHRQTFFFNQSIHVKPSSDHLVEWQSLWTLGSPLLGCASHFGSVEFAVYNPYITHMSAHIYIVIYKYMCLYVYLYIFVCVYISLYIYVCIYIYVYIGGGITNWLSGARNPKEQKMIFLKYFGLADWHSFHVGLTLKSTHMKPATATGSDTIFHLRVGDVLCFASSG